MKNKYIFVGSNSKNRDNWIIEKLKNLPVGTSILDAGAGEMPYKPYCSHLKYTSQDYCQYRGSAQGNNTVGLLNENWDISKIDIISDIIKIPVEDSSFDAILCSEVLEHLPYPIKAIEEFNRILKIGGELILTAPFASLVHQSPYFFYSGFSIYWYKKFLEKNNFEIIEMCANGNYFEYLLQEIDRLKYCADKYCEKAKNSYPKAEINKICIYLDNCSKNQNNSQDLLCFGWHILAKKRINKQDGNN